MLQRIITIEEALWLQYDEINAFQLLCEIQDWLGEICQTDFDFGWDHFMIKHGDRSELGNEAKRRGFDAAVANYDAECCDAARNNRTILIYPTRRCCHLAGAH